MTRIVGIDPGSRVMGYGVVELQGRKVVYVASGCVSTSLGTLPERIKEIYVGVEKIINTYAPTEMAIEKVFVQRNVDSALKLGQARGAAICAGVMNSLTIHEYAPNQIKKAVVGKGHAAKAQVQHMIRVLLNLTETPSSDAADALACAICHGHTRDSVIHEAALSFRIGRRRIR